MRVFDLESYFRIEKEDSLFNTSSEQEEVEESEEGISEGSIVPEILVLRHNFNFNFNLALDQVLAEALYQEPAPPSYQADSTSDPSHLTKSGSLCLHNSRTQSGGVAIIKYTPRLWSVGLARSSQH